MRNFRRLPPLLRITGIVGLLLALASLALLINVFRMSLSSFPQWPVDATVIALNVGMLSGSCSFVVQSYSTRFRQPGSGPFPLDSWQSQLRALLFMAALPLCALALAAFISPMNSAYRAVFLVTVLAAFALLGVYLWPIVKGQPQAD